MQPWVAEWTTPEMFAGVEGAGAEEVASTTALHIEHCKLTGTQYIGGAADIFKFFDQVQRDILYKLLEEAGMPKRVLQAYQRFLNEMLVFNTVAGGVGEVYHKPTSVPQGDPLSMMVTALLMRPWIMEMRPLAMHTRILADDLHILSVGPKHLEKIQTAFNRTHANLTALGAKVAAGTSLTFSSNESARKWLRRHRWRRLV